MKNTFSLIIWALVLSLFFSCAPSPSKERLKALNSVSPSDQDIAFWYQAGPDEEAVIEELLDEFNISNDYGIKVTGVNKGFHVDLWNSITVSDEKPDIFWFTADENKGLPGVRDLADLFALLVHSKWGVPKGDLPTVTETLSKTAGGYLVQDEFSEWTIPLIPILYDPCLVYCNLDRLNELGYTDFPESRDEFRQICEASLLLDDVKGIIYPPDSRTLLTTAYADGWVPSGENGESLEEEETLFSSGNILINLHRAGASAPALKKFEGQMEFSGGHFLFSLDAVSGARYYADSIQASAKPFQWSVFPFPLEETGQLGSWDRSGAILSSSPEEELASWIFLKWSLSRDVQAKLALGSGLIPVNPDVIAMLRTDSTISDVYKDILKIGGESPILSFPWKQDTELFYRLISEEFLDILANQDN
ncbi:MAG: extracellular solute-binding protein [Spirochaetales bacterium]|nr:extracellular solute-binding protein [Spirochaetales bacterium]